MSGAALNFSLTLAVLGSFAFAQSTPQHPLPPRPPADLGSSATIVPANEPGEPLVLDGQVFAPDGTTPIAGIDVHAYNTDAQGHYAANGSFYPPRLQGWVKTDAQGRFQIRTIRPGHYPGMHVPAHVHVGLWGAGYPFQYAGEVRFAGDPFLSQENVDQAKAQGKFADIVPVEKDASGVWHARFNLRASKTSNFPGVLPDYYK
jgi:protocatechuate 3,4-dioxygenase beta subunit